MSHGIKVYARKARRLINGEMKTCVDLASFTSSRPGSGKLGLVFDEAEIFASKNNFEGIYVESVINERLRGWLERRGYVVLPSYNDLAAEISPCYWKTINA